MPSTHLTAPGVYRHTWEAHETAEDLSLAVLAAFEEGAHRIEAYVALDDHPGQRLASFAGLLKEGIARGSVDQRNHAVFARLATDVPAKTPDGFRALLNSVLPRKRAISQLLIRSDDARVLLCQLTYKTDWDLPGGVVEVNESPQIAVGREIEEELSLTLNVGQLLLTDWLPAWRGWDDAICLVFDGGEHPASLADQIVGDRREIRSAEFCTLDQVNERCTDFTARRIHSALANLAGGPSYVESGG